MNTRSNSIRSFNSHADALLALIDQDLQGHLKAPEMAPKPLYVSPCDMEDDDLILTPAGPPVASEGVVESGIRDVQTRVCGHARHIRAA